MCTSSEFRSASHDPGCTGKTSLDPITRPQTVKALNALNPKLSSEDAQAILTALRPDPGYQDALGVWSSGFGGAALGQGVFGV